MRAGQGRTVTTDQFMRLPYLHEGPLAREWSVRARTFSAFVRRVMHSNSRRPRSILDLGAGNGWLSWRLSRDGLRAVAVDCRTDDIDGLAVSLRLRGGNERYWPIAASFEDLPFPSDQFDVVVFNASLHYAVDLGKSLAEARRVLRPEGTIAILDSPFYRDEEAGWQWSSRSGEGAGAVRGGVRGPGRVSDYRISHAGAIDDGIGIHRPQLETAPRPLSTLV